MSFYNPDVHTTKADAFIRQQLGQLIISDWARVEMTSALGIQVRRGDISQVLAQQLLSSFHQHCAGAFYKQISLTPVHFVEAERLLQSFSRKLRSADALHLALAKVEGMTLVTLDRELEQAAISEAVATVQL